MRKWIQFNPNEKDSWTAKMVQSAQNFEDAILLIDKQTNQDGWYKKLHQTELLAGFGALDIIENSLSNLEKIGQINDWYMGFMGYELKNDIYPIEFAKKSTTIDFPRLHFFRPYWLIRKRNNLWEIGYLSNKESEESALKFITSIENIVINTEKNKVDTKIETSLNEQDYHTIFNKLKDEIELETISGINLCIEFSAQEVKLNPTTTFLELMKLSPMPFSAWVKHKEKYVFSASPERYLTKKGDRVYSMPMKGTAPRGNSIQQDKIEQNKLINSAKERSENIMITDLVHNELSKIGTEETTQVEELCGIYSFPNVFQMVSTVSTKIDNQLNWLEAIKQTFPMGSMTGSPKIKAIELIDKYESKSRGLYSGSIGYISPEKDFDFNVVIRSLLYDSEKSKISFWAGSAITDAAHAKDEYAECLLKSEIIAKHLLKSED